MTIPDEHKTIQDGVSPGPTFSDSKPMLCVNQRSTDFTKLTLEIGGQECPLCVGGRL